MAKRKIQIIPPDGGYVDILHPETSADQVIATDGKTVETKLGELNSGKANTSHTHTKANITDFPSTMPPSAHTHAYAPTSHASTATTYGVGTTSNYGHVKTINTLTQASHVNGTALSAYQGKVLKDLIDTNTKIVSGQYTGDGTKNRFINLGFTPRFVMSSYFSSRDQWMLFATANIYTDTGSEILLQVTTNGIIVTKGDNYTFSNNSGSIHKYIALG